MALACLQRVELVLLAAAFLCGAVAAAALTWTQVRLRGGDTMRAGQAGSSLQCRRDETWEAPCAQPFIREPLGLCQEIKRSALEIFEPHCVITSVFNDKTLMQKTGKLSTSSSPVRQFCQ